MRGALDLCRADLAALPAVSRMADSSFRIKASKVSSTLWPACVCRFPSSSCLMYLSHMLYPLLHRSALSALSPGVGVTSPIPMEKPRFIRYHDVRRDRRHMAMQERP